MLHRGVHEAPLEVVDQVLHLLFFQRAVVELPPDRAIWGIDDVEAVVADLRGLCPFLDLADRVFELTNGAILGPGLDLALIIVVVVAIVAATVDNNGIARGLPLPLPLSLLTRGKNPRDVPFLGEHFVILTEVAIRTGSFDAFDLLFPLKAPSLSFILAALEFDFDLEGILTVFVVDFLQFL